MKITVNGNPRDLDVEDDMPLLWVLRDELATELPVESLAATADGAEITTIEGLGTPELLHAVQEAWIEHQVAQCGYCQSGQIMQAASLLDQNPEPTDEDIDIVMSGNLCRCGTYPRIRAAVKTAARKLQEA